MRRTGALSPGIAFSDQVARGRLRRLRPRAGRSRSCSSCWPSTPRPRSPSGAIADEAAVVGCIGIAGVLAVVETPRMGAVPRVRARVGLHHRRGRRHRGGRARGARASTSTSWAASTRSCGSSYPQPTTLYVNRRAEKIIGYPAESWPQPHFWHEHVHPDDASGCPSATAGRSRPGTTARSSTGSSPRRQLVWLQDRMRVEVDGNGHPTSVRGVMVDVTARKTAEQQIDQYVNLVEHLDLALYVFGLDDAEDDSTLVVLAVNPEGSALITRRRTRRSGGGWSTCRPATPSRRTSICGALASRHPQRRGVPLRRPAIRAQRPGRAHLLGQRLPAARRIGGRVARRT